MVQPEGNDDEIPQKSNNEIDRPCFIYLENKFPMRPESFMKWIYKEELQNTPDCPSICKQAGQVYEAVENYEEAISFYERAKERLTIHRNCEYCTVEVNFPYLQRRIKAVTCKNVLKHLTQNLASVAKQPKPNSKSSIENIRSLLLNPVSIGNAYRDQMNYVEAIKYYSTVKDDPEVELNLGIFQLMGRGCDENLPEAVKLISNAAQKRIYDATKRAINRSVYDARYIMDIFAKEGLGEDSHFQLIKNWNERRIQYISGMQTDKQFSNTTARSDNIEPSRTQLPPETFISIFDNAMELQKKEEFQKSLVLLKTASDLGYCKKNSAYWIKIVKSKLAIVEFTKRLPIIGDSSLCLKSDFFSCFLPGTHNNNGEHQKALEEYKKTHEKSLVIAVAEFLFGIEVDIDDFKGSIMDIFRTSYEKWRNNAEEDGCWFDCIDAEMILEFLNEYLTGS